MEEIRKLNKDDVDSVFKIDLAIFQPKDKNEKHHNPDIWRKRIEEGGLLLGVFVDGQLVGFTFGYPENEVEFHYWMGGVLKEYRGKGLGRKLLEEQEKIINAKGYKEITVNTYEHMWPIQFEFLKRHGYKIYKQETKKWDDGQEYVKSFFRKIL